MIIVLAYQFISSLRSYNNIYLSDASVLPDPPGVNPQFLIMQIASRNALKFLENENKLVLGSDSSQLQYKVTITIPPK